MALRSRRHFLKSSLGVGLTLGLVPCAPRCARAQAPTRRQRVLVVGAGIAGLVAAGELRAKGLEVIVVDARDRAGGRIWTVEAKDMPVELGAQWLDALPGNPALEFCRVRGLKTVAANDDSLRVFDADGKEFTPEEVDAWYAEATQLLERTQQIDRQRVEQRLPDITMAQAVQSLLGDASTVDRRTRFRNWVLSIEVEAPEAENLGRLGLRRYWGENGKGPESAPRVRLAGGLDQIVHLLARDLDIRLSRRVRVIRVEPTGVQVETDKESFQADRILVTLPLGVLKAAAVQFLPALPDVKLRAIAALGVGAAQRTVFQFAKPLANLQAAHLGYAAAEPGRFIDWTHLASAHVSQLSGWSHGDAARALERGGRMAVAAQALGVLRRMLGSAVAEPVTTLSSTWIGDPFSAGAYSYLPVGANYEQFAALAAPVGERLFFAGEATSRQYSGSIHGAWWSGLREAARIVEVTARK